MLAYLSECLYLTSLLSFHIMPFGLSVKCGIAACGMRKVICGTESVES